MAPLGRPAFVRRRLAAAPHLVHYQAAQVTFQIGEVDIEISRNVLFADTLLTQRLKYLL